MLPSPDIDRFPVTINQKTILRRSSPMLPLAANTYIDYRQQNADIRIFKILILIVVPNYATISIVPLYYRKNFLCRGNIDKHI